MSERIRTETCRTCKAWGGDKAASGQCRRLPPLARGVEPASWPMTASADWCLDHVAQEQKSVPRR